MMGAVASLPWKDMLRELSTKRDGGVRSEFGIDLGARGHEVRKLFFAGGYHRSVLKAGMDPDEAVQEVFRGILIRNQGRCPWDATKSSFGHYVHIVIRCVLSNYLRKERRRAGREFLAPGGGGGDEDRNTGVDGVTGADEEGSEGFARRELVAAALGMNPEAGGAELAAAVALVEGLEAGRGRRELAVALGRPLGWVEETVRKIRLKYTRT